MPTADRGVTLLPSVVFLYDADPSGPLLDAVVRLRASPGIAFSEVPANSVSCECFQRVRVPALILYNEDGAETASVVGTSSIVALVASQF